MSIPAVNDFFLLSICIKLAKKGLEKVLLPSQSHENKFAFSQPNAISKKIKCVRNIISEKRLIGPNAELESVDGNIEVHQLSSALVGANDFIDFDFGMQTISFIKNYSTIRIMPLPHRNTIRFFGMSNKNDYLIWRQQDGTFSALDKKKLTVTIWSTVTGKIIKTEVD